ncbi:MAG: type II secretion system protein [Phycisphaerales bacterium]
MPQRQKTSRKIRPAFTLIELLVVVAIIALLISLLLAGVSRVISRAKSLSGQRAVDTLVLGVEQFQTEFGFLPPLVHDGEVISQGMNERRPSVLPGEPSVDGPVEEIMVGDLSYEKLVVWAEGDDFDFFRRREGMSNDGVELPNGSQWDNDQAWDDLRYSKYSLSYYLGGVGSKRLDGVAGPGFARPQENGLFVGVGYPVGSTRDRYDPVVSPETESMRQSVGYFESLEYLEHDGVVPSMPTPPDSHVAFIDPWGRAIRYYRWEPGRLVGGRLVVESTLDLNIPPVLLDPQLYAAALNDPLIVESAGIDLSSGNTQLRGARYAIVSAGPDGLFGTEPIEQIAQELRRSEPTDLDGIAALRASAREDNLVGLGD